MKTMDKKAIRKKEVTYESTESHFLLSDGG